MRKLSELKLTVTFNELTGVPIYEFEGEWHGHDASLVSRKLPLQYRLKMREILRETESAKKAKEKELAKESKPIKEKENARTTKPARAGKRTGTRSNRWPKTKRG